MEYTGYAYRQVDRGPVVVSFVATTCTIDQWAKVPTKMARRRKGFQRAAVPRHVQEIRRFFKDEDSKNTSPTSIILGIEPSEQGKVRLLAVSDGADIDPSTGGGAEVRFGRVRGARRQPFRLSCGAARG